MVGHKKPCTEQRNTDDIQQYQTKEAYGQTMEEFDNVIGIKKLEVKPG